MGRGETLPSSCVLPSAPLPTPSRAPSLPPTPPMRQARSQPNSVRQTDTVAPGLLQPPHPYPLRDVISGASPRGGWCCFSGQSITPGTDSAAPLHPHPRPPRTPSPSEAQALGSALGGHPAPQPQALRPPAAPPGPPYPPEALEVVAWGGLGKFPGPLCQEVAGAPARTHPPEGGARGRCPMELGGGRRLLPEL